MAFYMYDRRSVYVVLIACAMGIGLVPRQAQAAGVRVFAAASLENALANAIIGFRKIGGGLVMASFGSSGMLARQIDGGAPADIFISADEDWMNDVQNNGKINVATRFDFLSNVLVFVEPVDRNAAIDIKPGFALDLMLGEGRLAMADPDSVPAGKYGKAALQSLGVWNSIASKIAKAEDVRAALNLVATDKAPLGIVYQTDANADKRVKVAGVFPTNTHPPIIYPAALMASSRDPVAARFLVYLRSDAARMFFTEQGFTVVVQ
jgi:molybdate transport system substrate-binding protein